MRYAAFVSYRHEGLDAQIAKKVASYIENWKIPKKIAKETGKTHFGRVFRDEDELQASSDLSAAIEEAIDETEWLIVVCTKRYKESHWCLGEIEYFLKDHDRDHIIVILAEGEPDESFPEILTTVERDGKTVHIEPLAVDIRAESEKEIYKNLKNERFRFFSSMLKVNYDDLKNRQRLRRLRFVLGSSAAAFCILIGVLAVILAKNIELNHAYDALDKSMQDTLKGESYYLSEYADEAYANGDPKTAIKLSLQALPDDLQSPERPYVSQAMTSLTKALGVYDHSDGYRVFDSIDFEGETFDVRTEVSPAGDTLLVERYTYAAGNMLDREVRVYRLTDGRSIFNEVLVPLNRSCYHSASAGAKFSKDGKNVIFASADGLKVVEPETAKVVYTGKQVSEIRTGANSDVVVAVDYDGGYLYEYGSGGEEIISCEIGKDMNYTLGQISPDENMVALSAKAEGMFGIITIDLKTGENAMIQTPGEASDVRFIDKNRLCFLQEDSEDGIKHIVYYNLSDADEGYLCNTDWDVQSMAVSDAMTVYYYHDNRVFEVDCKHKKGKKIWEKLFSSNVVSVITGKDLVAITCRDGSVNIFTESGKQAIGTPAGDKTACYMMNVDAKYACMRDYWGKHIRIYRKSDEVEDGVDSLKLASAERFTPKKWYPAFSGNCEGFGLGLHSGNRDVLSLFDGVEFAQLADADLDAIGYEGFDNLALDVKNRDYFCVQDFGFYTNAHFLMKSFEKTMEFGEDSFYFYEETGEKLYLSKGKKVIEYEAATGKKVREIDIPDGFDRGVEINGADIFGNDDSVRIVYSNGTTENVDLPDAVLYSFNAKRNLIFYRNKAKDRWFAYDIVKKAIVCEGEAGAYSCVMFFDNNRYLLNDYNSVYDMDTWEKVLDLKKMEGSIYGVQTTDESPYFAVMIRQSESDGAGNSGSNMAYLYDKKSREIVGEIPDFVTMTPDGRVVSFDGKDMLYRFRLYSATELIKMAKDKVGGEKFTDAQREEYHLYNE